MKKEIESTSRKIGLVINVEVHKLGHILELDDSVRFFLEEELVKVKNRTYLWLHLTLDAIHHRLESVSQKQLRIIIGTVPDTVDKAYTAILERSDNIASATKLLHITVHIATKLHAAIERRQQLLSATDFARDELAVTVKESSTSYEDLDLVGEEQYRIIVRNLCGLFVSVIDSKIYLVHQTAR